MKLLKAFLLSLFATNAFALTMVAQGDNATLGALTVSSITCTGSPCGSGGGSSLLSTSNTWTANQTFASGIQASSITTVTGIVADGATDNTTVLQAAINTAATNNGGILILPPGIIRTGTLTLKSSVTIQGAGIQETTLELKDSVNGDLLQGNVNGYSGLITSMTATYGSGALNGTSNWVLKDLTLNGDTAHQNSVSGDCLHVYGYGWIIQNVQITQCSKNGMDVDYNNLNVGASGTPLFQARIDNVSVSSSGIEGVRIAGPSDIMMTNLETYRNGSNNFHVGPNAGASLVSNLHSWGVTVGTGAVSVLIEEGNFQCTNCEAEGSDTANVVWLGSGGSWNGGYVFGISGTPSLQPAGFQIGQQAGNTAIPFQAYQSGGLTQSVAPTNLNINWPSVDTSSPAISFANDGGNSRIFASINQSSGSYVTGSIQYTDSFKFSVSGLTCSNGSLAQCGGQRDSYKATNAMELTNGTNDYVYASTFNPDFYLLNGMNFDIDSGAFSGNVFDINGTTGLISAKAATFTGNVTISSGLIVNSSAGTNGQFLTSGGPGTAPSWTTPSGGVGSSTITVQINGLTLSAQTTNFNLLPGAGILITGSTPTVNNVNLTFAPDTSVLLSRATDQANTDKFCHSTAANQTLSCALNPTLTTYTTGQCFTVISDSNNVVSAATTLNINTLGALNVYSPTGTALSTGAYTAEVPFTVCLSSSPMNFIMQGGNATGSSGGGSVITPVTSTAFWPYGVGINASGNYGISGSSVPRYQEFIAPYPGVVVSSASAYVATDAAGGVFDFAVYSSTCGLLGQTNSKTGVGANPFDSYFSPAITLTAGGKYFLAFVSNVAGTVLYTSVTGAYAGQISDGSESASNYHYFDGSNLANLSGGVNTFPATCGTRTNATNVGLPGVVFH